MFSTFDSGVSRNNNFNNAIDAWKTPQISTALHTNSDTKPIKIKTPYVKEPFGDIHGDIYQQPLLSVYEPYTHDFAMKSYSSISNAPLLQKTRISTITPLQVHPWYRSSVRVCYKTCLVHRCLTIFVRKHSLRFRCSQV